MDQLMISPQLQWLLGSGIGAGTLLEEVDHQGCALGGCVAPDNFLLLSLCFLASVRGAAESHQAAPPGMSYNDVTRNDGAK